MCREIVLFGGRHAIVELILVFDINFMFNKIFLVTNISFKDIIQEIEFVFFFLYFILFRNTEISSIVHTREYNSLKGGSINSTIPVFSAQNAFRSPFTA